MRKTSLKEIESVLRLDGPSRYEHFVKRVVDAESAWGLWRDGWALMRDERGTEVFPLWPAREYAELCRRDAWAEYEPAAIALDDLLNDLLPKLDEAHILPGVFPIPTGLGVTATVRELDDALRNEMEKYD